MDKIMYVLLHDKATVRKGFINWITCVAVGFMVADRYVLGTLEYQNSYSSVFFGSALYQSACLITALILPLLSFTLVYAHYKKDKQFTVVSSTLTTMTSIVLLTLCMY